MLIERISQKQINESIFDVVNQFNRAADLIEAPEERLSLVRLNVIAGIKARAAIAYASARNYFVLAEALLAPDAWGQRYQETFDLYLAFSECDISSATSQRLIIGVLPTVLSPGAIWQSPRFGTNRFQRTRSARGLC